MDERGQRTPEEVARRIGYLIEITGLEKAAGPRFRHFTPEKQATSRDLYLGLREIYSQNLILQEKMSVGMLQVLHLGGYLIEWLEARAREIIKEQGKG